MITTTSRHIDFEPVGKRVEVPTGTDILEAARLAGIDLISSCGGAGVCGKCRVHIIHGDAGPISAVEHRLQADGTISENERLACQVKTRSDLRIDIGDSSLAAPQRLVLDGTSGEVELNYTILALDLQLEPPNLQDLRADLTRVNDALAVRGFSPLNGKPELFAMISKSLREQGWAVRLAVQRQGEATRLVSVLPPGTPLVGLAVDLGSTKLALFLIDLSSGRTLAASGVMNPQISYGEDVVSRIAYADCAEANAKLLHHRLTQLLDHSVGELCMQAGLERSQIVDAVVVGNTAMHHFFLGLPVKQLGAAPYLPAVADPMEVDAVELGLELAAGAKVYLPANMAGYVGGDHAAALLATVGKDTETTRVLVDIGTNTEVSLIHQGKIYSCSTASGPAFEGAYIRDGMRAAPGAIEWVKINGERVEFSTVGGAAPVGICGSGILQAVAEMRMAGILDVRGAFSKNHPGVTLINNSSCFVIVPAEKSGSGRDIIITRKDVHEIQLAKGAIRAGIEILLARAGISADEVEHWVIAGAFGTYLDIPSALRIGLFPNQPLAQFEQVGNAAGVGARWMLLSQEMRRRAYELVRKANYVELTTEAEFTDRFVQAMYL